MYASDFFNVAIRAARRLDRRALLITGQDPVQCDSAIASAGMPAHAIRVFRYVPYSRVFPHAAVNVHQGGIGTLAQALAAGRPQLIVPAGFDQPDNARRAMRLGLARAAAFRRIDVNTMTSALSDLLSSRVYATKAAAVAGTLAEEERQQRALDLLTCE
jgi:UDP:flavonoid glycosyltransferase YjiC (YdhE family)